MQQHRLLRYVLFSTAFLCLGTTQLCGQNTDTPSSMPQSQTPTAFDNPELVQRYQASITPEELSAHLYFFASDFFEGRETATRGQKLAAHYLASQYRRMGLMPKGNAPNNNPQAPDAYFQPFKLHGTRLSRANLDVMVNDKMAAASVFSPTAYSDQMYLLFGASGEATGGVVFAGYGIADDNLGYNDLTALEAKGIDLAGKWVLVLRDEPMKNDSTSLLPTEDGKVSAWTTRTFTKLRGLMTPEPAGLLIVADAGPGGIDVGAQAAAMAQGIQEGVGTLSLEPRSGGGRGRSFPATYMISSALADQILASAGRTVAAVKQGIDGSLKPDVFALPNVTIKSVVEQEAFTTTSENVAAFIEGSDPNLKHEVVVLSSHYDHIGIDTGAEGDRINNGADDDGSGTVTTLEMADAFIQAKHDGYGPRRSILFLNVAGEEKGLLGSRYFTDMDPLMPLDDIVTNLNIDMIGRYDPTHPGANNDYVYIIGSKLISQELHDINARLNEITGINLDLNERFNSKDDPQQFYRRSDHWNFGKHSIPFIFFFTGTHEDYHGVDDEADKIEYDRMARIARLIFATAWQVANQDTRPAVSGEGFN